jgi:hypothetical protein
VRAAVLEGDAEIPNLVAVSYYDQKPVHFLSTICETIKWIVCEKSVYCVDTEKKETMKFLRLNINNDYNHDMGSVDIADQLRNYYRFDHWMRKRKWWWAIFFWNMGVLLVNSYVSYKTYMESIGERPISHYNFRKAIALSWIDWKTYWPDRMRVASAASVVTTLSEARCQSPRSKKRKTPPTRQSSRSATSTETKGDKRTRAIPLTTHTLCPHNGKHRDRLRISFGDHFPEKALSYERHCGLCMWATKGRNRSNILHCSTCNVHLCITCFKAFHCIRDVKDLQVHFETIQNNEFTIVTTPGRRDLNAERFAQI